MSWNPTNKENYITSFLNLRILSLKRTLNTMQMKQTQGKDKDLTPLQLI